jgi:uncharacterized protein (DUF1800 family)
MITRDAVVAAQRFGFGAPPAEMVSIDADPRGWVKHQIRAEKKLPDTLAALPSTLDDQLAFFRWLAQYRKEVGAESTRGMSASVENSYVKALYPRYRAAVKARFDVAVSTPAPVFERLVHFWSNHFVVSGAKPVAIALPPSFERDAIRPFVTGRFADMLLAVIKHPAMLIYLDNTQSIGARSDWARNPPRRLRRAAAFPAPTGLNENLAREILELHTVGVAGGYDQTDVTSFANIITGWQVVTPRQFARFAALWAGIGNDLFYFNPAAHEPGAHTLMGKRYPAGGVEQGEAALTDLARHPATARFIAFKMARHFVADNPPPAIVARLARVFQDTDGDLGAVAQALVDSPEAWAEPSGKLKQPEEYLISAVRTLGGPRLQDTQLLASLNAMGQRPYMQLGPDGWSDQQDYWLSPDGIWKRIEWAQLAGRALGGAIPEPDAFASAVFGAAMSANTRLSIARAESPAQAITLLLAAPEFMRR